MSIYNVLSLALGAAVTQVFELPPWVTPAIAFNNTTSLPLLLIQSLDATGILSSILMGSSDSTSDAVNRAKSYFLVNAIVGNPLTFALGPELLNVHTGRPRRGKANRKQHRFRRGARQRQQQRWQLPH